MQAQNQSGLVGVVGSIKNNNFDTKEKLFGGFPPNKEKLRIFLRS